MLTYDISERGNLTIYEYLYRCIKDDIIKGRFSLGEKLPSKRKMAQQHQISLKTVENAYEQLLMEGYISAREKSGYYVMETEAGYEPQRRTSYTAMQTGSRGEEASNITIDLTSNRAAIEKFPYDTWAKVMRGILSEKENVLLDTVPFAGVYELRAEIARYLYEYRGMDVEPEQIIIGAGTEYLYGRLLQLLGRNSIYAIEDPGYHRFSRIYHANDLQWRYVEIDEDGIVIDYATGDSRLADDAQTSQEIIQQSAAGETAQETTQSGVGYVANMNTKKFHYPSCSSVRQIKAENRWDYTGTREELISMGYDPCRKCNP